MKKNLNFYLLGSCLLTACVSSPQFNVSGCLTGLGNDTLLVRSYEINSLADRTVITDTVPVENGIFKLNLDAQKLQNVMIMEKPSLIPDAQGRIPAISMKGISFVLLPGKHVTINGTFDDYTLGGDEFYEAYNQIQEKRNVYVHKLDSLGRICMQMEQDGVPGDSIRQVYAPARKWIKEMGDVTVNYISQYPDQDVSLFLLSQGSLKFEVVDSLLEVITENVRNGIMKPLYQDLKMRCEKEKQRLNASRIVKEGLPAPDFVLKDMSGHDFSLSSLKGKYVVLDFWGSWCGWCIKGLPDMKQAYKKYKDKIEFVGIACNDTEEKWKTAVAEHKIPWINVRNTKQPDVAVMYGVAGYPTKIVIDKEGNILKKVVGEDSSFYTYLDEIFK